MARTSREDEEKARARRFSDDFNSGNIPGEDTQSKSGTEAFERNPTLDAVNASSVIPDFNQIKPDSSIPSAPILPLITKTPLVDRSIPLVDRSIPSVDRSIPSVDRSTPSVEKPTPLADRSTPSPDRSTSSTNSGSVESSPETTSAALKTLSEREGKLQPGVLKRPGPLREQNAVNRGSILSTTDLNIPDQVASIPSFPRVTGGVEQPKTTTEISPPPSTEALKDIASAALLGNKMDDTLASGSQQIRSGQVGSTAMSAVLSDIILTESPDTRLPNPNFVEPGLTQEEPARTPDSTSVVSDVVAGDQNLSPNEKAALLKIQALVKSTKKGVLYFNPDSYKKGGNKRTLGPSGGGDESEGGGQGGNGGGGNVGFGGMPASGPEKGKTAYKQASQSLVTGTDEEEESAAKQPDPPKPQERESERNEPERPKQGEEPPKEPQAAEAQAAEASGAAANGSKVGGVIKGGPGKLLGVIRAPVATIGGVGISLAAVILVILIIVLVILIVMLAIPSASIGTISTQNTRGKSAAFFEFFGASGGEGTNKLNELWRDTITYADKNLQTVNQVRTQFGFKLKSLEEINKSFGGGTAEYNVEVSQINLTLNLTVPAGFEGEVGVGEFSSSFGGLFNALNTNPTPPNLTVSGGNEQDGLIINFNPSICDGLRCTYQQDYYLITRSSYTKPIPPEAFGSGSGVFTAVFGGTVDVKIKRSGQPDESSTIPIYPPVTVCIDIRSGTTRECGSPVGDGNATASTTDSGSGVVVGQTGGVADGFACPFDQDASKGILLRCTNGFSTSHLALDLQVRDGNGSGTNKYDTAVRSPVAGVISESGRGNSSSCGNTLLLSTPSGATYVIAHLNLLPSLAQDLLAGITPTVTQSQVLGSYFVPASYNPNLSYENKFLTGNSAGQLCWTGPHIHIEYKPQALDLGSAEIKTKVEAACTLPGKTILKDPLCQ